PGLGMYPVGFAGIDCDPMSVKLRRGIRRARVKRRCFVLRDLLSLAKQLGCRGLIESSLVLAAENANGFEQAQSTDTVGVDSVFRRFERDLYMRLRGEIINFIRLRFLHDADDVGRIRHIAVMQMEGNASLVRIANEMVDTGGVERGRTALDAMDHISSGQQECREVGAILPGSAGDDC